MAPQLIIFDVYGTLIKSDVRDGIVRPGFRELLDAYPDTKRVAFSDGAPVKLWDSLSDAGIYQVFNRIYHAYYCTSETAYTIVDEDLRVAAMAMGGGTIKRLTVACDELQVARRDTVFLGDNFRGRDKLAGKLNRIKFIQVPQFREVLPVSEEKDEHVRYERPGRSFSFASLIGKL